MAVPFAFGAVPPEMNTSLLLSGPGPAGAFRSAAAHRALAEVLKAVAASTEGSVAMMASGWHGASSDQAQSAFRKHTAWLRKQAAVAEATAAQVTTAADACAAAQSAMVGVAAALAANKSEAALLSVGSLAGGATTALLIANQAEYFAIWASAAAVMEGYAATAMPALSTLPPPVAPPPIVGGTGGGIPVSGANDYSLLGSPHSGGYGAGRPGQNLLSQSHSGGTAGPSRAPSSGGHPGGSAGQGPGGADQVGDAGTPGGSDLQPQQPISTPDPASLDPLSSAASESGFDPSSGVDGYADQPLSLVDVNPRSPTLAGLSGGASSMVALRMVSGGAGSMAGAATGFRMPSNWVTGTSRAFGASATPSASPVPASRSVPPRGATAPAAQRKRKRDKEAKSEKVFAPGSSEEVPVLEQAVAVGVFETDVDEFEKNDEVLFESALVGILASFDDEEHANSHEDTENVLGDIHSGRT